MIEKATFAGGCYWCLEAYFQRLKGVTNVVSGYTGGTVEHPTSQQVYDGGTGHTEAVTFDFDSAIISYEELLQIFFVMHDPTTLNRQGADVGDHYRSAIFYHTEQQKIAAKAAINGFAADLYKDPIVTQLVEATTFWPADDYMQDFYNRNPNAGYCMIVIDPKIQKLRQKFADKLA